MQPNSNDPLNQGGPVPGAVPPAQPAGNWPPQAHPVPDWQQGLGTHPAPGQPAAPTPGVINPGMPGVPPSQPGYGAMPGAAPQPGYGVLPTVSATDATMPAPKKGLPKPLLAGLVVLAALIVVTIGLVIFAMAHHPSANNAAQTSANNADKHATALSTLNGVDLAAPTDMSGFDGDVGTGTAHDYTTTGTNSTNGGCELAFGTATATALPGNSIDEIVAPGIKSLHDNHVTVDGPKAGDALILKDASGNTYSLPTITYSFTQQDKNAQTHYGIAILKDGSRVYVRWDCAVHGPVDQSKMNMLAQKAAQITVTVRP